MTAISQMTAEHQRIAKVIDSLEAAVEALEKQQALSVPQLRTLVEFLRVYADERHHHREEKIFFPLLIERGVPPQGCPIGGLTNDHAKGRAFVSNLESQIDAYEKQADGAADALKSTLQDLAKLYRHHLWMEDAMVFPMAEKIISDADDQSLRAQFEALDRTLGEATIARLEQFGDKPALVGA